MSRPRLARHAGRGTMAVLAQRGPPVFGNRKTRRFTPQPPCLPSSAQHRNGGANTPERLTASGSKIIQRQHSLQNLLVRRLARVVLPAVRRPHRPVQRRVRIRMCASHTSIDVGACSRRSPPNQGPHQMRRSPGIHRRSGKRHCLVFGLPIPKLGRAFFTRFELTILLGLRALRVGRWRPRFGLPGRCRPIGGGWLPCGRRLFR